MTWDTQGCLPSDSFTVPACPSSAGNLDRVGVELMGLAEFVQQLPQIGKGEGEALGYGKNNINQGV